MYNYLICITLLKSINPYFRKHVLDVLSGHDLLFINTFFIACIVFVFLLYKIFFDRAEFNKTLNNYKKLTITHYCCILTIATFAVISNLLLFTFDKKFNTPFLNATFIKIGAVILLFFTGILIFGEEYNKTQCIGILLIIAGFFLTQLKT
jgi:drug/metabolite transporter (DMT)-like permease